MRRIFWLTVSLGAYFWILTSGNDQFLLNRGKMLYQTVVNWLEEADADFQLKEIKSKKKSRRWD